ncbi:cytochrome c class I [Ferroglobus placidus DSM 10642]|uniref:Cytochrome c class I n=1 Tax=Ferroglobus placidus (strain DSM 10642 / AEDII12DO) TaxID=589924 RepID=D3S2G0_FERPA|nr:c-type cytochrome [Ferroglobus placidus]ADC64490.1 cytochrome c class I [Ferroglobus placidus DSM 10642]
MIVGGNNFVRSLFLMLAVTLLLSLSAGTGYAQTGEEIFSRKCVSCHTIGGGDLVGPDLLGITEKRDREWLIKVIVDPDSFLDDPIRQENIAKYGVKMPDLGLSEEEAVKIIEFLSQFAAQPSEVTPEETPEVPLGDPEIGRALFIGEIRFANGGPPCVACHSVRSAGINGGTLANDLSDLYARLGDRGIYGALKSLQFPVMKDVYAGKELTEEEVANLAAFFKEASEMNRAKSDIYPLSGIILFLVAIGVATVYFRRVG